MAETTTAAETGSATVETANPTPAPTAEKTASPKTDWVADFVAGKAEPEAPVPKVSEEKPADKRLEVKTEANAAAKPEAKDKPKAEKPEETVETLGKRLKDTRDYATRVDGENKTLRSDVQLMRQELETLKKKLDGTYEEPQPTPPAEVQREASLIARVRASHAAALDKYGAEELDRLITGADAPWKELEKDPVINAQVFASELPMVEAVKAVKAHQAKQKYGTTDVETLRASLREELTTELREKIRADLLREIRGTGDEVKGLSGVPSGGRTEPSKGEPDPQRKFASLFPNA